MNIDILSWMTLYRGP